MVVGENVENTGGGVINSGVNQLTVRTVGRVRSVEEIAGLPVKFAGASSPSWSGTSLTSPSAPASAPGRRRRTARKRSSGRR